MTCEVKYIAWVNMEIPDELLASGDEDSIIEAIYAKLLNCLDVRSVYNEKENKFYVENY